MKFLIMIPLLFLTFNSKANSTKKVTKPISSESTNTAGFESSNSKAETFYFLRSENKFNGNYLFEVISSNLGATISTGNNTTSTGLNFNLAYLLQDKIQVGGEISNTSGSFGNYSYSGSRIGAFGVYNLESFIANSAYFRGGIGILSGSGNNNTEFYIGGGKRFPIWNHVSLSPEVRLIKSGSTDPYFQFQLLNISFLL